MLRDAGEYIGFVYLPDQDRGVPLRSLSCFTPFQKKDFRGFFLKALRTRGVLGVAAVAGAVYLNSGQSFMLFLLGLIFGIIPVFDTLIQWLMFPGRTSPFELKNSMVHSRVFYDWIEKSSRSKWPLWVILAILGVVYAGQMKDGGVGFNHLTELGKISRELVRPVGEWWRIFTGSLMHAFLGHLALNALALFFIGKFIHRLTHPLINPIVFTFSAFTGAIASTLFASEKGSVGASGGVVGMIGFLAWLVYVRRGDLPYDFRSFTIRNILLLTLLGAIGFFFVDNAGHAGGLLGGVVCGIIYDGFHRGRWDVPTTPVINALGIFSFAILFFGLACCMDLFYFQGRYLISHLPKFSW